MSAPTSYQTTGTVTNVGITAALSAGNSGPQINITGFTIGSLSAVDGSVALPTDTSVDGLVYTGTAAQMSYLVIDTDTVMWRIMLDTTVGNFNVGNVGIMEGNVLFGKAVLPGPSVKYQSIPPTTVGNIKFYNIIMRLANIANLLNLTIIESATASLPEVPTELVLPPAISSPFDCYLVDNHTHIGVPTTAVRLNGNWYHAPHRINPAQGLSILASQPTLFDIGATAPCAVYMSTTTKLFEPSDSLLPTAVALGMRTSTFEVTTTGQVLGSLVGVGATLTPGTIYYVGTGAQAGQLVTTPTGNPVAIAVSTTDVFLDFSAAVPIQIATTTSYGVGRVALLTEAQAGVTSGIKPAFMTPEDVAAYVASNPGSVPVATTTSRGITRIATNSEAASGITTSTYPAAMTPEDVALYVAAHPGSVPVATTVAYGIARQATVPEALAYSTSGLAPAFITPEDLGAVIATIAPINPFTYTGIGAAVITFANTTSGGEATYLNRTATGSAGGGVIFLTGIEWLSIDGRWGISGTPAGTWILYTVSAVLTTGQATNQFLGVWIRIA